MSRITKEKIEKTKCGRFLLSDENIYLSIYSLNSYVFEYNLLNTEDRILYHRLQDKFDARLINRVITRVRKQIIELLDEDKYIEAKVYFKPKKLSENGELEFRPLHSTDLITQIAIVSMLHLFVYEIPEEEEGDPKLRLSNLSRLIPSDFYGNRVSVKPEYLFKPWKQQYQKYNQNSNDALMKYHTSLEYKYEVTLDLENFFPTINPIIIYHYVINHLPAYLKAILYEGDSERLYIRKLIKLPEFSTLNDSYIAYIQVGGAYAHNYLPMLRMLKMKTLIITDLDYDKEILSMDKVKAEDSKSTNATINHCYRLVYPNKEENYFPTIKELYDFQVKEENILCDGRVYLAFQDEDSTARTLEEAMLKKILGFNVFHMIKRSEWKKIRKDKNLIFSIPNNKKGEKDSEYSIRKIVEATSNNKTDFMYSVILSENEEKMLPDYIKKGLLWLMK